VTTLRPISTPQPTAIVHTLRDVRDVEHYVSESLAAIGVEPTSEAHRPLLEHGVRSAYRLERALPPETSLRAVLDEVLPLRLSAPLRCSAAGVAANAA
jgi:hypothetical protein